MTTSRKIRLNRPMRKAKPGDVETIARDNKDKFVGGGSVDFQNNFSKIKWGSRKKPSGYRVRKVTHAAAGLPVYGNP